MTRLTITTAALLASTSAAFAGPADVPPPAPPVYVEPETCGQAFDCFYGGVELGFGDGYVDETFAPAAAGPVTRTLTFDGEAYGVFAGYNFQNGNMVYGGEVRFLHANIVNDSAGFEVNSIIDLRGRVGIASNDQFLIYGAAGWSVADAVGAADFEMSGLNYGVGVEYNISESLFLGADVTGRQVEGSTGGFDYDAVLNTATLRAGFRF